jgi:hypothetical protein
MVDYLPYAVSLSSFTDKHYSYSIVSSQLKSIIYYSNIFAKFSVFSNIPICILDTSKLLIKNRISKLVHFTDFFTAIFFF